MDRVPADVWPLHDQAHHPHGLRWHRGITNTGACAIGARLALVAGEYLQADVWLLHVARAILGGACVPAAPRGRRPRSPSSSPSPSHRPSPLPSPSWCADAALCSLRRRSSWRAGTQRRTPRCQPYLASPTRRPQSVHWSRSEPQAPTPVMVQCCRRDWSITWACGAWTRWCSLRTS